MGIEQMIKKGTTKRPPRILLMGVEGIGKSTAGLHLPNPVFLCAENGLVGKQFADVHNYSPMCWSEIYEFVLFLISGKHNYQSLVIDTIDWLEPLLFKHIANKENKGNIEDIGFNKGYKLAAAELRTLLEFLERLNIERNFNFLFNAHTTIKTFTNPLSDNYDRYEIKMHKEIAGIFKEWCDCMLFANYALTLKGRKNDLKKKADLTDKKRIVYTERTAGYDAKNRYNLPSEIVFDMSVILNLINSYDDDDKEKNKTIKEIKEKILLLSAEKQKSINVYIEKNKNNLTELKRILNRVLSLIDDTEEIVETPPVVEKLPQQTETKIEPEKQEKIVVDELEELEL